MGGISPQAFSSLSKALGGCHPGLASACTDCRPDVPAAPTEFVPDHHHDGARRLTNMNSSGAGIFLSDALQRARLVRTHSTTAFSSHRQGPRENVEMILGMPVPVDDGWAHRKERSRRLQPRRCFVDDLQFRSHRMINLFTSSFEALASDWADWSRRTMRSLGPGAKGALLSWRQTDA